MNALAIRDTDELGQWHIIRDQATMLIKSQFLPKAINTPEKALAIILTGRELGIGTMAALNTINVIAGKPTISPQLMLALINRTKDIEDMSITDDGQACTVMMKRRGRQPHKETFSMKDASLMKTTEYEGDSKKTISLSEKYNWKQMPAVMRKWRAVAACARVVFPDVILGLYTPEEMGAQVSEEGEVIDMPVEPTIEPEPEPATVEAEPTEAEPKPADEAPMTRLEAEAELRHLAHKLKYADNALLKWLRGKYGFNEGMGILEAIRSLGDGELNQAIDIFAQHAEAAKTKGKGATQ